MKRILSYILLGTVLLGSACSKDAPSADAEGSVSFRINMGAKTRTYDPLQTLLIRVYNADGGLIRRYTSLDEMPQALYLAAGNYRVTVDAGDKSAATWTNKSYHGEQTFTVTANRALTEQVTCPSINVGAKATFDASVAAKLDKGATVRIWASNTLPGEEDSETPMLQFDASTNESTGYFLLPEGTENLCWSFSGEGTEAGTVEKTGVIEQVQSAMIYALRFQFSNTPDGFANITVSVDQRTDECSDEISFNPQPAIKGENCSMSQPVGFHDTELRFSVSSIKDLATITLTADETSFPVFDGTTGAPAAEGITCEIVDSRKLLVTLTTGFFAQFAPGVHAFRFDMTDTGGGKGSGQLTLAMPGLLETTSADYDLWHNTAVFKAVVTDPAASNVQIACRIDGGEWHLLSAAAGSDFTYTAGLQPKWIESVNSKQMPVYALDNTDGFTAGRNYEYKLVVNGADCGETRTLSTTDAVQEVPKGNMEDSGLSCFSTDNKNAPFWGSGNNSFTSGLCTQSTFTGMQGSKCAKLTATSAMGILASGNLFTGCFDRPGGVFSTTGYVYFGLSYPWTARPKSIKVKYYAEKLGTVNIDKGYGAPLKSGDQDKARIFVAIVDWNSRHLVTSGGSAPQGTWDPAQQNSTSEGRIIAYGSLLIEQASQGGTMIDADLPLYYYDRTAEKPGGNYSLVISCSTSAYGDYMAGCDSNVLYVDDFRWEY